MRKKVRCEESLPRRTSSRGAVERAIDISKGDRSTTWEDAIGRTQGPLSRWDIAHKENSSEEGADDESLALTK